MSACFIYATAQPFRISVWIKLLLRIKGCVYAFPACSYVLSIVSFFRQICRLYISDSFCNFISVAREWWLLSVCPQNLYRVHFLCFVGLAFLSLLTGRTPSFLLSATLPFVCPCDPMQSAQTIWNATSLLMKTVEEVYWNGTVKNNNLLVKSENEPRTHAHKGRGGGESSHCAPGKTMQT